MTTKIKGFRKGFKFISQIFVVKEEREMEIGYPTDVKHVAHIGWDNQSGSAPAWMNDFKCSSDFSTTSLGSMGGETDPGCAPVSSWCSQDFDQPIARQPSSEIFNDAAPKDIPKAPKKQKRKKTKSPSSPKSTSSSLRGSRVPKASSGSTTTNGD